MELNEFENLPMGTHVIVKGAYGFGDETDTELIFVGLNPNTKQYDFLCDDESDNGMSFPVEVVEALASKTRINASETSLDLNVLEDTRVALIHAGNQFSVVADYHELADECHRLSHRINQAMIDQVQAAYRKGLSENGTD